jgi:hypothetical protein
MKVGQCKWASNWTQRDCLSGQYIGKVGSKYDCKRVRNIVKR